MKRSKTSQCAVILRLLKRSKRVRRSTIIKQFIANYTARISVLRQRGHDIRYNGDGTYTLKEA